jgi:hypothetical protein
MTTAAVDNAWIAQRLREMAALLEAQGDDNPYRAAAYRRGGDRIASLGVDVGELFEREGKAGLVALPDIGERQAGAIAEMLTTGGWRQLDRLRGDADPEALLRTVPGIGAGLAHRLNQTLGVDTLEALEVAAHDGRLEAVPHVGARRAAAIRAALKPMLDRLRPTRALAPRTGGTAPPVDLLLEVDQAYREAAEADRLPKIAPRRFNPTGEAWLPVLHTRRGDWQFTALYSNTARAHQLGRERDWVVLYVEDAEHAERQYTVVTEARGTLAGLRVVRGREAECRTRYRRPGSRQVATGAAA